MAHLKRYSMPGFWPLARKAESYVTTPVPGPHPKYSCIPLRVLLRDSLKAVETADEARRILNAGKVLVDKKIRKHPGFPVGLMDVIEVPDLHARYRVNMGKRGLVLEKIKDEETSYKLCRITGKSTVKGGMLQFSLHDGRTVLSKEPYMVGDSLMIGLPHQDVLKHFSLRKGEACLILAGRNMGATGKIKAMKESKSMLEKGTVTIETEKGKDIETLRSYVMVGSYEGEIPKPREHVEKPKVGRKRHETPSGKESKA